MVENRRKMEQGKMIKRKEGNNGLYIPTNQNAPEASKKLCRQKRKTDQDQGLLLNPSNGDLFFEAIPSGGIPHASFCPPEGATIAPSADPNDKPGLSEKPKPCTADEGFEKGLIIKDFVVADEEYALSAWVCVWRTHRQIHC